MSQSYGLILTLFAAQQVNIYHTRGWGVEIPLSKNTKTARKVEAQDQRLIHIPNKLHQFLISSFHFWHGQTTGAALAVDNAASEQLPPKMAANSLC